MRANDSGSMSQKAGRQDDQWRNQLGFALGLRNEESCCNIGETPRSMGLDCQASQRFGEEGQRYEGAYYDLSEDDEDRLVHVRRLHEVERLGLVETRRLCKRS